MNVILVDDEKQSLEKLEAMVRNLRPGAGCVAFGDADSALEYVGAHKADVVILNFHLREADSAALGRTLRERCPRVNLLFCAASVDHAMDAWEMDCSAYLLRPITEEKLRHAFENLRYPVEENRVEIQCFGNFEVYCDGEPIWFKYSRTKELFAYLVDRKGARCSIRELAAVLFGDDAHRSYMYQIRLDLVNTLDALGVGDIISHPHGYLGLVRDRVKCDYYDYLDHRLEAPVREYMTQYSFGEQTCAALFMEIR